MCGLVGRNASLGVGYEVKASCWISLCHTLAVEDVCPQLFVQLPRLLPSDMLSLPLGVWTSGTLSQRELFLLQLPRLQCSSTITESDQYIEGGGHL